MACNSSSLSPSWALLLFVAIIGLASSLQVYCVQNMALLQQLNKKNVCTYTAKQMLDAVKDKDKVELGRYTVRDILAIADQDRTKNCLGDTLTNHRMVMDYYADNHGLVKFYLEHYDKLVEHCVQNHHLVLDQIRLRLTNTDLKNLIAFEKVLPEKYVSIFKGSVNESVSSYMSASMGKRTISNNYVKLGLKEELETSCKRLLTGSSSFALFRNIKGWYTHWNSDMYKWDRISRGCEIYLEKLAPSVLNQ